MTPASFLLPACALLPAVLMLAAMPHRRGPGAAPAWGRFRALALAALAGTLASLGLQLAAAPGAPAALPPGLGASLTGAWVAALVQLLGTVIGVFSSRYLQGEANQPRYVAALGGVLAAVHVLLLAGHWRGLSAAWAAGGWGFSIPATASRPSPSAPARSPRRRPRVAGSPCCGRERASLGVLVSVKRGGGGEGLQITRASS